MSRGGPKPTFGVRVRLDFVIVFDEPQGTLPIGGPPDGDMMFKACADAIAAKEIPHAVDVRAFRASFGLDPRLTAAAIAKRAKVGAP